MPTPVINFGQNDKIQSPYLYIQAAGSDGADGSTKGVHLRWTLRDILGDNHIPKGNLAEPTSPYFTTEGYNKSADYVKVYRVPYTIKYAAAINFEKNNPVRITEVSSALDRTWEFDSTIKTITSKTVVTTVVLRFKNTAKYDEVRATLNPLTSANDFIKAYDGVIEVEAKNKLSFAVAFHTKLNVPSFLPGGTFVPSPDPSKLRVEAISLPNTTTTLEKFISCRHEFIDQYVPNSTPTVPLPIIQNTAILYPNGCNEHKVMAENMKYARFDFESIYYPAEIYIETYEDFFTGANLNQDVKWQNLGNFGLSINDVDVFSRLDNNYQLNGNWPKFNNVNAQNGAFTVKKQNYIDRWSGAKGLKYGVQTYLDKSRFSNPQAIVAEPYDTTGQTFNPPNTSAYEVNYFELLQMVAMDFHVARMMGLGHIDTGVQPSQKFIYLSVYGTNVSLQAGDPASLQHFYMTLPTGRADNRLPLTPVLKPVKYGLEVPSHPEPIQITDSQGYVPNEKIRYISLYKETLTLDRNYSDDFFSPDAGLFCAQEGSDTVFVGVEYRKLGEPTWRIPELLSDPPVAPSNAPEYTDPAGYGEVFPLMSMEDDTKPVFIHEETEAGQHIYGLYAVNWFSRASAIGNNVPTDVTVFKDVNTLLPPSKFAVQLIQKEQTPIFTTPFEQQKLELINPSKKEILVRAEFNWNHVQIAAYQIRNSNTVRLANKAQLFFRDTPPVMVRGRVVGVTDLGNNQVEVTAGSYVIYSSTSNPAGELIMPVVDNVDAFKASLFVSGEKNYLVESVSKNGGTIKFTLRKVVDVSKNDVSNAVQEFSSPVVGEIFAVIENLSADTSWSNNKLTKEVQLINFETTFDETGGAIASRTHRETVIEKDGLSKIRILGGIFEKATIEQATEMLPNPSHDPNDPSPAPLVSTPVSGVYLINFDTYLLDAHPDAEVQWVKGSIRIPSSGGGEKKLLDVWSVDRTSTLKLLVFDATSSEPDYVPIQTGSNILVNYHPGYRAYFTEQTSIHFDKGAILPSQGDLSKETYMAIRAEDTTEQIDSFLATPVILYAREISDPLPPAEPIGPKFATRPDFYGKSTYTFDTIVNTDNGRKPFSLVFYRASERSILDELYKQTTVEQILSDLSSIDPESADATFTNSRWYDLANAKTGLVEGQQTSGKLFNQYVVGGYRFPIPDNDKYKVQDPAHPPTYIFPFNGTTAPGDMIELVQLAITGIFLPLTEQPVLYRDIVDGYQTLSRKPTLRNSNGNRLAAGDPGYDPNPMVVKFVDSNNKVNVRFTDYTLDGSSINTYFYYAQELANDMIFSEPGGVAGPIRLVNSYPAQAPQVRKFTTQLDNPVTGEVAAVLFELNSYIPSEKITKVRIYRALNADDARSIRTMKMAKETTLEDTSEEVWKVMDDFSDEEFPLFGETLFYRLVVVRTIINEKDEMEDIPSLASDLVLGSIVDVFNPQAPDITVNSGSVTTLSPATLPGVKLKWNKVTHNATYYVYKMNDTGNWNLLDKFKSNDTNLIYKVSADLAKEDEDGNTIFHRYKVDVENASGLLNLEENAIVI
ncbi:MAG TPA: hypothetical protein VFF27_00555 [Bacteroidia bacterium]|nr:hypothetical protein [Bacteroidia bacterium]